MANKEPKQQNASDTLMLALKVIGASVVVFLVGYYMTFWVVLNVGEPFLLPESKAVSQPEVQAVPTEKPLKTDVEASPVISGSTAEPQLTPEPQLAPEPPSTLEPKPPSGQGGLVRVRLGLYGSRAEAEAALATIRTEEPGAFIIHEGDYRIQVGAFTDTRGADTVATKYRERGFPVQIVLP